MIKFTGKEIKGTHGAAVAMPPALQTVRTYYWGLKGQTEIVGGTGGRELMIKMWIHGRVSQKGKAYAKRDEIEKAIKEIDKLVGKNGTLEIDLGDQPQKTNKSTQQYNKEKQKYNHCTFVSMSPDSVGSGAACPYFDWAGTVDGGWFMAATLTFYQLRTS